MTRLSTLCVVVALAVAACGGAGPLVVTESTLESTLSLHSNSGTCDLSVVISSKQGVIGGVVESLKLGFEGGLPWDVPGREYGLVQVKISEALAPVLEPGSESFFVTLEAGTTQEFLIYPDIDSVRMDEIQELVETGEPVVILLASTRNWDDPTSNGMWTVARVVSVVDGRANFLGGCSDKVNEDFQALAKALRRPADKKLVLDFAAETFATQDTPLQPGPIGETLYKVKGMWPLPEPTP